MLDASSNMCEVQKSLGRGCFSFKVLGKSSIVSKPSKRPFDNPAESGNGHFALLGDPFFWDFDADTKFFGHLLPETPAKSAVGKDQAHIVQKRLPQVGEAPKTGSGCAIVAVGRDDLCPNQVAQRVDHDKALSALDEFATVNADALGRRWGVLDGLAVDDDRCWTSRFVVQKPVLEGHFCTNQIKNTALGPFMEIPVDGLPCRKIGGQIPPDHTVFGHVKDSLEYPLQSPLASPFYFDQFFDSLPLGGGQIG